MADELGNQTAPVQVQVVPGIDPETAAERRFSEKLDRMGTLPTMTEGDRTPRPAQDRIPGVTPEQAPQKAEPETQTEAAEAAAADGDYEFEWNGNRYAVPPELKELHDGYLRQQDYTAKTQEVAEIRRSAEVALQQSNQQRELQTALAPHVNRLNAINEQLNQYANVDWNKLMAQDSVLAQQHSVQFSILNNQKQMLERQVQTTAQEHMRKIADTQKQLLESADKAMAQKVKGWTRDTGTSLNAFARQAYGFTENEVNTTLDPRVLEMMHDAKQFRDLQASKAQKIVPMTKTLKPGASQGGTDAQAKQAELRRAVRVAKTDGARDRAAEALIASRIR